VAPSWPDGAELATETTTLPAEGTDTKAGRLLAVDVPLQARALTLRAPNEGKPRWALAIVAPPQWLVETKARQQAGDLSGAQNHARDHLPGLIGVDRARVLGALGRLALAGGRFDDAEENLRAAESLHRKHGHQAEACDDLLALAHISLQHRGRFGEASKLVDQANALASEYPDGLIHVSHFRGLVAAASGDMRSALRFFDDAMERARRLGFEDLAQTTALEVAQVYQQLGKWDEMFESLQAAGPGEGSNMGCQQADWLTSQSWALLMAGDAQGGRTDAVVYAKSARALLVEALDLYDRDCPDSPNRDSALLNIVLDDLQRHDAVAARVHMNQVRMSSIERSLPIALWWHELRGRIALAEDRPSEALGSFATLERLAAASAVQESRWRGALGRARAQRALGRFNQASAAFADAERVLDETHALVSASNGRSSLLSLRETSAREWVEMLVDIGRTREAFAVVRRTRRRLLSWAGLPSRVASLKGHERVAWDKAMETYRRERTDLDAMAAGDWALAPRDLATVTRERRPRVERMLAALDEALSVLGARDAAFNLRTEEARVEPGELWLVYFPIRDGWLAFGETTAGLRVRKVGSVAMTDRAEVLGASLLEPFLPQIEGAQRIFIVPWDGLSSVDFHALPVGPRGKTLVERAAVAYSMSWSPSARTGGGGLALVVGDSQGDLPLSAAEGSRVADLLRSKQETVFLRGAEATRARIVEALALSVFFHYAGHAVVEGTGGWQSALPLAEGDRLEIGDILSLARVPDEVVLSGCDTGRRGQDGLGEGIGLSQAFLIAGASSVVATNRPVRDEDARLLLEAFYRFRTNAEPPEALRRAQMDVREMRKKADWAAVRVLQR
jgi:hypothetical protein